LANSIGLTTCLGDEHRRGGQQSGTRLCAEDDEDTTPTDVDAEDDESGDGEA